MILSLREYFLFAMNNECYNRKEWCFTAFTQSNPVPLGKNPEPYVGQLVTLHDGEIGYISETGEPFSITGVVTNEATIKLAAELTLESGDMANVKSKIVTTYGRALANAMVIAHSFGDKLAYMNEMWSIKQINDSIARLLKDDVITVEELKLYYRQSYFLSSLTQLCVPSASAKSVTTDPNIAVRKKELLELHKDELHDPAVVSKIEQELIEMDRAFIKGDISEGFYKADKSFNVTRKRSHLMHGGETAFSDETKIDVVPTSLQEGWDPENLPTLINSLRDGSFSRGAQTALGGEAVKAISRVFQNSFISEDDCKDKVGIPFLIDADNYKMFVGRFTVEDTKVSLTEANLKGYIGKAIVLRSPMSCKVKFTDYCKVCMGDEISDNEKALSLLAVNVGSAFLSLFLAAFHGKALLTAKVNLNEAIV